MKRFLFTGLLILAVTQAALSQPSPAWVNSTTINSPPAAAPQVYAFRFENSGTINLSLNTFTLQTLVSTFFISQPLPPFDFTSVNYFTNRGTMTSDTGFTFDTAPSGATGDTGARHMAGNFGNANIGVVSAGSLNNFLIGNNIVFFFGSAAPQLRVSATNIVNEGLLNVGINGLIAVSGKNVDLSYGALNIEGLDFSSTFIGGGFCSAFQILSPGIFDNYWGIGRGTNIGGLFALPTPITPFHIVTAAGFGGNFRFNGAFAVTNAQAFANTFIINNDFSNLVTQVVFVGNSSSSVATTVRFQQCGGDFPVPVVQWLSVITNSFTQEPITNTLYLSDFFGGSTNLTTRTNYSLTGSLIPTQSPVNYQFSRSFTNFFTFPVGGYDTLPAGNIPFFSALLAGSDGVTNAYSAYGVTVAPVSARPDPTIPSSNVTNVGGRIEITGDKVLDLTGATVTGANYVRLAATNHFAGSEGGQILAPVTDLNLATTNGLLSITNLVAPYVPRMNGDILAWSGQWTNVSPAGVTNRFHVLMVASGLIATSQCSVLNFLVRSTNVVISDVINVTSNILVNAQTLTITTNEPGAPTPVGQLNLRSANMLWSSVLPNLQSVTNFGIITSPSSAFFQKRQTPDFVSPSDGPYASFVNHGSIHTSGNTVWANYFENTGSGLVTTNGPLIITNSALLVSSGGPISVRATSAVLSNGVLGAVGGDLSLASGNLVISNQVLQTSGKLILSVTNQLNFTADGSGRTWTNFWQVSDSFDLPIKPASGDLLGTTVTSLIPGYTTRTTWAGQDLGQSPGGFVNNAAVGHLILDATVGTGKFRFSPVGASNAIYVDLIDLKDFATNRVTPNFTALIVDPGMKVYFADARIGNLDISEKLNGANGGRILWVSNYNNGPFSSTNLVYPSGTIYSLNRGLVLSSSIDSDGDGIVNSADSTPILEPENLVLSVMLTNSPSPQARISWVSPAYATNYLYRKTGLNNTNWLMITNFVTGSTVGPVTVSDKLTNGPCLYRVGLSLWQP
jgi:hypothetical protein